MLEDERGGLGGQVLKDVQGVVHVRQVGLAGVLARLEHVLLGQCGDQSLALADELHAADFQLALRQLVQGGGLVRVFAVAQSLGLAVDLQVRLRKTSSWSPRVSFMSAGKGSCCKV